MKKIDQLIILLLMIAMTIVISGCSAENVNLSGFEEIDYEFAQDTLEEFADRFNTNGLGYLEGGWLSEIYLGGNSNVRIRYSYYDDQSIDFSPVRLDETNETTENYIREDGVDIRDVERMHNEFEEQYNLFEEFCSDNPDCIQMEMQDDRGYIIFDIEDPEIIAALSGESEVSEGTRYYGVRYHCDRCYITATYMSDSNDDFRDFVSLLDELGLPHM